MRFPKIRAARYPFQFDLWPVVRNGIHYALVFESGEPNAVFGRGAKRLRGRFYIWWLGFQFTLVWS